MKVPGAIGYVVELDKRCSIDTNGDLLYIRSSEVNTQLGNNVGTNFQISKIPHHSSVYILQGKQIEIDFRVVNPRKGYGGGRGRGGGLFGAGESRRSNDEYHRRWGIKLTVKPIFGGSKVVEGNKTRTSIINNLVQSTCLLAREFSEARFIRSTTDSRTVSQDSNQAIQKILNWHLLKGGIKVPELEGVTEIDTILNKGLQVFK